MVVFTKEPRVEEALRRANKYGANKYGGNGVGKQLVELLLEERSFFCLFADTPPFPKYVAPRFALFFRFCLFADTPPFPSMSHPVSPICQKLILFFRFFRSARRRRRSTR